MDRYVRLQWLWNLKYISIPKVLCAGRHPYAPSLGTTSAAGSVTARSFGSRLVQRHGHGVHREGGALPVVAGRRHQADPHRVGTGLPGVQDAEADAGGHRGRTGGAQVAVDAGLELRRVGVLAGRRGEAGAGDRLTDTHVRRDRPGVGDHQGLRDRRARLQVGEVQREGALGVVAVAERQPEGSRTALHAAGAGRAEVRAGGRGDHDGGDDGGDDAADDATAGPLAESGLTDGHRVHLSAADAAVCGAKMTLPCCPNDGPCAPHERARHMLPSLHLVSNSVNDLLLKSQV